MPRDTTWTVLAWGAYFLALVASVGGDNALAAYGIGMGCFFLLQRKA